ncbi:MAG: hypothetical protein AAF682_10560 [Planctomycetota bacterium]
MVSLTIRAPRLLAPLIYLLGLSHAFADELYVVPGESTFATTQVYFAISAKDQDVRICGISTRGKGTLDFEAKATLEAELFTGSAEVTAFSPAGWTSASTTTAQADFFSEGLYLELAPPITIPAGELRNFSVRSILKDDMSGEEKPGLFVQNPIDLGFSENEFFTIFANGASEDLDDFSGVTKDAQLFEFLYYAVDSAPCGDDTLPVEVLPPTLYDGPEPGGVGPLEAGKVYVVTPGAFGWCEVPAGKTLTADGAILALADGTASASRLNVKGSIDFKDTVITSVWDDTQGGDTDGELGLTPRDPEPGDWGSIYFQTNGDVDSIWSGGLLSYGGGNPGLGTLHVNTDTATVTVEQLGIDDCDFGNGFTVDGGNRGDHVFRDNIVIEGAGLPWGGFSLDMLDGFRDNLAFGNVPGDYLTVTGSTILCPLAGPSRVTEDVVVNPWNYPGPVLVIDGSVCVEDGASLTFKPGVNVKFTPGTNGSIETQPGATLSVEGTGAFPVRFTSLGDDSVGGDTDKNGVDTSAPGDIIGLRYFPGVDGKLADAVIRKAGQAGAGGVTAAVTSRSDAVSIGSVRIEDSAQDGLLIERVQGDVTNVLVKGAQGDGIELNIQPGSDLIDMVHVTSFDNGGDGIRSLSVPYGGEVLNSISWNNAGDNFGAGFDATNVGFSLGDFAGIAGNLDQDPLLDASGAPLSDSAVVDAGTAYPLITDLADGDRAFSPGFLAVPDMGALEWSSVALDATPLQAGSTLELEATALTPSPIVYAYGLPQETVLPGLGLLGFNPDGFGVLGVGSTDTVFEVTLPAEDSSGTSFAGINLAVQGFAILGSGAILPTNLIVDEIDSTNALLLQ